MGIKHLKKGDPQPPPVAPGKLRLYSMVYCPYAQRARIALHAKGVQYEEVNINLKEKPEWYSSINAQTKVPALDDGGKVVIESLDIADYLDNKVPAPALWPSDPQVKARHKKLIDDFGKITSLFYAVRQPQNTKPFSEIIQEISTLLKPFEEELAKNNSTYFFGSRPGMLDYMIWPWAERAKVPSVLAKQEAKLPREQIPKLLAWRKAMWNDAAVKATAHTDEQHIKYIENMMQGKMDYDNID